MSAHISLTLLLFAVPALVCAQAPTYMTHKMPTKTQAPAAVHRAAIVIDTHADTPQRFVDEHFDLSDPLGGGNLNLASAHQGNLGAEFFSIWVDPTIYKGQYARRTLELIDSVKQQVAKHPKEMIFVATPGGIEMAHHEHKLAALMGIEGGHSIEDSIPLLRQYYALGVRYMTLTWTNSNGWADSSGDINDKSIPHTKEGLNQFGKDVVHEMNRLGMMVDISHVSDRTFYRALVISRAPVIASHSDARALCDAPRNMTDDMLRAIARSGGPNSKGGVVQINFSCDFLNAEVLKTEAAGGAPTATKLRATLSDVVQHIDHVVAIGGIGAVGLGSDFDGISCAPVGLDSVDKWPNLTRALLEEGYTAVEIRKMYGENTLRLMTEVERVARSMR